MAKKKWLTTLDEETIGWLKETAQETGLSGGTVISELVTREMQNKSSRFRQELLQAKLRIQLQKLNDEDMELQARKAELLKRMKNEKVLVNA